MALLVNPSSGKVLVHNGKALVFADTPILAMPADVFIDRSDPSELYLEVSNTNNTAVTLYVTVYDSDDMAFGAISTVIEANTADDPMWIPLDRSSVETGYIEAYFTADGYKTSEILTEDWDFSTTEG